MEPSGAASAVGWVRLQVADDHVRIELGGEVDASMQSALERAVMEARARELPVEVDTSAVTFMDSLALASLARLAAGQRTPIFVDPPALVRFLLEVTRLGEVVQIRDTGQDASAAT